MNRSVANILFAGFGGVPGGRRGDGEERPHTSIGAQDAAIKLAYADSVVIVPGYGLLSRRRSTPSRRWRTSWRGAG